MSDRKHRLETRSPDGPRCQPSALRGLLGCDGCGSRSAFDPVDCACDDAHRSARNLAPILITLAISATCTRTSPPPTRFATSGRSTGKIALSASLVVTAKPRNTHHTPRSSTARACITSAISVIDCPSTCLDFKPGLRSYAETTTGGQPRSLHGLCATAARVSARARQRPETLASPCLCPLANTPNHVHAEVGREPAPSDIDTARFENGFGENHQ